MNSLQTVEWKSLIFAAVLSLCLMGCGDGASSGGLQSQANASPGRAPAHAGSTSESSSSDSIDWAVPVRLVVFGDKTASTVETVTPQLSPEDFELLFDVLRSVGGELAYGSICANSDRPLLRLVIQEPPFQPEPAAAEANVFRRHDMAKVLRREQAAFAAAEAEWQQETDRRIARFLESLRPLLAQPATCGRTDIVGALERADLYLSEPTIAWSMPPREFAILVSDGQDNVRRGPVQWKRSAQILIINGTGGLGALQALGPVRFESVSAALGFVRQSSVGGY